MAEAFPRTYALLAPGGSLGGIRGYYVFKQDGSVAHQHAYAVGAMYGADQAGVARSQAYAAIANPAAVAAENTYGVYRHDVSVHTVKGYVVLSSFYIPYDELSIEFPFCEERFPTSVSYGSSGGPGFKTSVFQVDSGLVHTTPEWERIRARYDVTFDHCPRADIESVENFFYSMRGQAVGFRFKDWSDYQIVNQNVVIGDGNSTQFQLFKRYRSGGYTFDRMIKKPSRGGEGKFTLDGVELILNRDYYINYTNGMIIFNTPPEAGAIGHIEYLEYDVPVRFETDSLMVSAEDFNQYSISSLNMIEILV